MPTETSIGVSNETLELLKAYKDEFQLSSLDEAIQDSLRWAKLWITIDFQQRRSLQERINNLEFQIEKLETDRERDLLEPRNRKPHNGAGRRGAQLRGTGSGD